jgi:hypothetical protein
VCGPCTGTPLRRDLSELHVDAFDDHVILDVTLSHVQ